VHVLDVIIVVFRTLGRLPIEWQELPPPKPGQRILICEFRKTLDLYVLRRSGRDAGVALDGHCRDQCSIAASAGKMNRLGQRFIFPHKHTALRPECLKLKLRRWHIEHHSAARQLAEHGGDRVEYCAAPVSASVHRRDRVAARRTGRVGRSAKQGSMYDQVAHDDAGSANDPAPALPQF